MIADALEPLPPSCRLVALALEKEGELTQQELRRETYNTPQRTIRYALDRLESEGLIEKRPSYDDARQSYYSLRHSKL